MKSHTEKSFFSSFPAFCLVSIHRSFHSFSRSRARAFLLLRLLLPFISNLLSRFVVFLYSVKWLNEPRDCDCVRATIAKGEERAEGKNGALHTPMRWYEATKFPHTHSQALP
jgi:hypothetical protein